MRHYPTDQSDSSARAFHDPHDAIRGNIPEHLDLAVRPANSNRVDDLLTAQTKMQAGIAGGQEASTAQDLLSLRLRTCSQRHLCTDRRPVTGSPLKLQGQP